jgi:hypothetical protein
VSEKSLLVASYLVNGTFWDALKGRFDVEESYLKNGTRAAVK